MMLNGRALLGPQGVFHSALVVALLTTTACGDSGEERQADVYGEKLPDLGDPLATQLIAEKLTEEEREHWTDIKIRATTLIVTPPIESEYVGEALEREKGRKECIAAAVVPDDYAACSERPI